MNGKVPTILLGALLTVATAACGGSNDASTSTTDAPAPPPSVSQSDPVTGAQLPSSDKVEDVPVTKPANPKPVDVESLPATARAAGQMPGLSETEKTCTNAAIKSTLDADPSIAAANAKVASVLGNSVVACTDPPKLASLITDAVANEDAPLTPQQKTCMEATISKDPAVAGRFLSALLTMNVGAVTSAAQTFEQACGVKLT